MKVPFRITKAHFHPTFTIGLIRKAKVPPLPVALFVALNVFGAIAQLTAYRVLLVWLYDRTGSLLLVTLMHGSLTASTIFIFRPLAAGASFLMYGWILAAALWVVAGVVPLADSRHRSREALRTPMPA
jgi:hypothetical protein